MKFLFFCSVLVASVTAFSTARPGPWSVTGISQDSLFPSVGDNSKPSPQCSVDILRLFCGSCRSDRPLCTVDPVNCSWTCLPYDVMNLTK